MLVLYFFCFHFPKSTWITYWLLSKLQNFFFLYTLRFMNFTYLLTKYLNATFMCTFLTFSYWQNAMLFWNSFNLKFTKQLKMSIMSILTFVTLNTNILFRVWIFSNSLCINLLAFYSYPLKYKNWGMKITGVITCGCYHAKLFFCSHFASLFLKITWWSFLQSEGLGFQH
jgi:hypothetical protein